MHEVSIAQSLLDLAIENCKKEGYTGIEQIRVKIGKAAGIMPDALQFAFESMKIGTIAEKAALLIDEIPVSGFCEKCKSKFTVNDVYIVACPNCGHFPVRIESGRELNIDEMEVF